MKYIKNYFNLCEGNSCLRIKEKLEERVSCGYIYNLLSKLLIELVRFYRKYLSGMKRNTHCKYIPTCSQYAIEALDKYGPFKGLYLSFKRILRCNPFSKGGYDPIP